MYLARRFYVMARVAVNLVTGAGLSCDYDYHSRSWLLCIVV